MKVKQKRVRIESTPLGRGVFSAERIRGGQIIGEVTGTVSHDPDTVGSEYCIELGGDMTLDPAPPFRFLNHSCQPNCELFTWEDEEEAKPGVPPRMLLQTLTTIRAGEELTIDYAWPADMAIPCGCQSSHCRGWIVDANELEKVPGRVRHV
jgi:hypothetical protein